MRRLAISGVVCLPSLVASLALADAPLRLNEIRLEQAGADLDEYIEIAGASGESLNGVSIVVVGDDDFAFPGQQNGTIESVVSLDGRTVPTSGFFVVAGPKFSLGVPNLVATLNLEGGDNVTIFLVRGFTGFDGQKLDTNDDGVLDVTPWTSVVSSLAVVANSSPNGVKTDYFYSTTTVGPDQGSQPAAAWRCANSEQWNIGTQNPFEGVDSPGVANQACVPQGIIINEIRIDDNAPPFVPPPPASPINDPNEFFELKGAPGQSLDGYTYIVIGDGTGGSGVIENAYSLTGRTLGADGLASFAQIATLPNVGGTVDYLITPTNNSGFFENSDNVTHMLVQGFTGAVGNDLDTNNDGILDLTPWASIADAVAIVENPTVPPAVGDEWVYAPTNVRIGPDGTFVPGHIFRCSPSGTWQIGLFSVTTASNSDTPSNSNAGCTVCGPGAGNCHAVHATPGCVDTSCCNAVCVADPTCCSDTWDQACVNQARTSCLTAGNPPALTLNEIRIDETSNVDPNEYLEIKGAPGTNLNGVSIVVVGDGLGVNGVVEAVVSLNGSTIPNDGHFLVAESTFTLGTADKTAVLNFENGDSVTYFLVWNFTGLNNTDYDIGDDCALDSQPWDATIDSVGVRSRDGRCVYSTTTVGPDYSGLPAHIVRCNDGAWRFGRLDPAATDGFGTPGTANLVCPPAYACGTPKGPSCFDPHGGLGCSDASCCESVCQIDVTCCEVSWDASCAEQATLNCFIPAEPPAVEISEIRIDQQGNDNDEYFEIVGEPNTLLNGLTYVVIGDSGTGATGDLSGRIEYIQSLNGNRISEDGFFLALGEPSTQFASQRDIGLSLPSNNFENSDNVTHMLVWGFTGTLNQDLDTNNDGVLDITPWTNIIQSVAFIESAATPPVGTGYAYGDVRVGPDSGNFVPSQLAYCPSTSAWTIGTFAVNAKTVDSPGVANFGCDYTGPACPADFNSDGIVDSSDLGTLLSAWGTAGGDTNGDGTTDSADLGDLLSAWGACQ
jgi:hypothetical protein